MGKKRNINTLRRIQRVCEITNEHYEPGNLRKCYKAVFREYVYPIYPMCYRTYLNYLSTPLGELKQIEQEADEQQLKLF